MKTRLNFFDSIIYNFILKFLTKKARSLNMSPEKLTLNITKEGLILISSFNLNNEGEFSLEGVQDIDTKNNYSKLYN